MDNSRISDSSSSSSRTFKSVKWLFVLLVISLVRSDADPRPRNVSVDLVNPFCLKASWERPETIEDCNDLEYEYFVSQPDRETHKSTTTLTSEDISLEMIVGGGRVEFSIQTGCPIPKRMGDPVVINVTTNPELVQGFDCALHTTDDATCSWTPYSDFPDLRLFYLIVPPPDQEDLTLCSTWDVTHDLKECVISPHPDGAKKNACHLQYKNLHDEETLHDKEIYFLFKTQDEKWKNMFHRHMHENLRPKKPLTLRFEEEEPGKLHLSWDPPDIGWGVWSYNISYTEGVHRKNVKVTGETYDMTIDPRYQYKIKVQGIREYGRGLTEWSDEIVYGENVFQQSDMIQAILIALLLIAAISSLTFCAFRKYKDQICPPVPQPKNLLKDNNIKCPPEQLYVPAEETECVKICLETEADHQAKPDALRPSNSLAADYQTL